MLKSAGRVARVLVSTVLVSLVTAGFPVIVASQAQAASGDNASDSSVTERPDAVSAMVTARVSGHRVEDLSQRTETTEVFANPDGSWSADQAPGPVRARDAAGNWADIDTDLVAVDGGFAPKNVPGDLVVSDGGEKSFATLDVDGRDLSWQWPSKLPAPTIDVRFPPDRRGIDNEDRDAREAEEVRPGVP